MVAGDVHRAMKLSSRMPAICDAFRSSQLQAACGVKLVAWSGPKHGSTSTATFSFEASSTMSVEPSESVQHPGDGPDDAGSATPSISWSEFQRLAKHVMEKHFGLNLTERRVDGIPKRFDLVSADGAVVGDAKNLTLVRGVATPPAKFKEIAGHVWLLEKTAASRTFLVLATNEAFRSNGSQNMEGWRGQWNFTF